MQLKKIKIKNFQIYNEEGFEIKFDKENNLNVLIGKNNSGKSTILKAISLLDFNNEIEEFDDLNVKAQEKLQDSDQTIEIQYFFEGLKSLDEEDENIKYIKRIWTFKKNKNKKNKNLTLSEKKGEYYILINDDEEKINSKDKEIEKILDKNKILINYFTPKTTNEEFEKIIKNVFDKKIRIKLEDEMETFETKVKKIYNNDIKDKIIEQKFNDISQNIKSELQNVFSIRNEEKLEIKEKLNELNEIILKEIIKNIEIKLQYSEMDLKYQGTGFQRVLTLLMLKNSLSSSLTDEEDNQILLIDEPEVFLHPDAIRGIKNILYNLNSKGIQTIISTHSPIMIDFTKKRSLMLFKIIDNEENNKNIKILLDGKKVLSNESNEEYKLLNLINPFLNEYFFADKVIIVEGNTEEMILNSIIQSDDEFKNESIKIINAHGRGTIKNFIKILNIVNNIEYSILFDLDNWKESKILVASKNGAKNIVEEVLKNSENNNRKILVSNGTLEFALTKEIISNENKTKNVTKILNDENNKKTMKNIIKFLINKDENLELNKGVEGFHSIKKSEDLDFYYEEENLIEKP